MEEIRRDSEKLHAGRERVEAKDLTDDWFHEEMRAHAGSLDVANRIEAHRETMAVIGKEEESQLGVTITENVGLFTRLAQAKKAVAAVRMVSVLVPLMASSGESQNLDLGAKIQQEYEASLTEEEAEIERELVAARQVENEQERIKASEALLHVADKNPQRFIAFADEYSGNPGFESVVLTLSETDADNLMPDIYRYQDESYFEKLAENLIVNDPRGLMYEASADSESWKVIQPVFEKMDGAEARFLRDVIDSEISERRKRNIADISDYAVARGLSIEDAVEVVDDPHRFFDARMYELANGSETERKTKTTQLASVAQNRVEQMNELKGSAKRFDSVKGASALELYGTIAYGGDDAIESTAKPLLRFLNASLRESGTSAEEFVDSMNGVGFAEFATTAANMNRLGDFLDLASSPEAKKQLMKELFSGLGERRSEQKIDALAQIIVLSREGDVQDLLKEQLREGYLESVESGSTRAEAAYGLLSSLYEDGADWLGEKAPDYKIETHDRLEAENMFDEDNQDIQLVHFYNDDDGIASYYHFLGQYINDPRWEVEKNDTFTVVKSKIKQEGDRQIVMYANLPEFSRAGHPDFIKNVPDNAPAYGMADVKEMLEAQGKRIHVEVHRGHAYYNAATIGQLSPDTKLYIDGSCGGADKIDDAVDRAPQAQFVYNSQTGRSVLNDAILVELNNRLLDGEDIVWSELRSDASKHIAEGYVDEEKKAEAKYSYSRYFFPDQVKAQTHAISMAYEKRIDQEYEG